MPLNKHPRILGISHFAVKVSNIEKSVCFYRDFLGFQEQGRLNYLNDGSLMLVVFKVNNMQTIEVFTGFQPGQERLHQIAFYVDDIELMREHLNNFGYEVIKPFIGQMKNSGFIITDPCGYSIEFLQHMPGGWTLRDKGKFMPESRISSNITHGGVVVNDLSEALNFYGRILGFEESWRDCTEQSSRIHMTIPGSTHYIELISDSRTTPYFALDVPSIEIASSRLENASYREKYSVILKPSISEFGKRILTLSNNDGARIELTETR